MNDTVIADSSYLVALFDGADALHAQALALASGSTLRTVFLDCVMNEVLSVLGKRAEEKKRLPDLPPMYAKILQKIPPPLLVWTYREVPDRYGEIVSMMGEHLGRLNFHDCLIALTARDLGIAGVISFDADFDAVPWLRRISG